MLETNYKYLNFVHFHELINWSVQNILDVPISFNANYSLVKIGDILKRNKNSINIQDDILYKQVTIKVRNGGVVLRDKKSGRNIGTKRQFVVSSNQFILSKIDARNGAMGIVPSNLDGAIVTPDFLSYEIDEKKIVPQFLVLISTTTKFLDLCQKCSSGTTNRQRLRENLFLEMKIPLPAIEEQNKLVLAYNQKVISANKKDGEILSLEQDVENYLTINLGVDFEIVIENEQSDGFLKFVYFKQMRDWGVDKILNAKKIISNKYEITSFSKNPSLSIDIFRGKSPKYSKKSDVIILNQKCIRWNYIDTQWAKKVSNRWLSSIKDIFFTREYDVLINSTGEGTIGRSTIVQIQHIGLLYDSHVLLLRVNKQILNPQFFVFFFNSVYGQSQVNDVKSAQSTKQTELGINNLEKILFPLPPIKIQEEIVSYISDINNKINQFCIQAENERKIAIMEFEKQIFI